MLVPNQCFQTGKNCFVVFIPSTASLSLLYFVSVWQCCKHDTLISAAKYLTEDAPLLLSSDNLKDVNKVISAIFFSLPSDFKLFIQCVEAVHRNEWVRHDQSLEHNGSVIKVRINVFHTLVLHLSLVHVYIP